MDPNHPTPWPDSDGDTEPQIWYRYNPVELTAVNAELACIASGGHLATIQTAEQQAAVDEAVPTGQMAWIGLHVARSAGDSDCAEARNWVWYHGDDQAPLGFDGWGLGQPDNAGGDPSTECEQECVQFGTAVMSSVSEIEIGTGWADSQCAIRQAYVCGYGAGTVPPPAAQPLPPPPPPPFEREVLVPHCAKRGQPEAWGVRCSQYPGA